MNRERKDYLHLYLGCRIWDSYNKKEGILFGINRSGVNNVKILYGEDVWNLKYTTVKPILRPLSDWGVKEQDEYRQIYREHIPSFCGDQILAAKQTLHLISKQFDLFGLIDAGLAIDATTLKVAT